MDKNGDVKRYSVEHLPKEDNSNFICQNCNKKGHFTYECKFKKKYKTRLTKTQLLRKAMKDATKRKQEEKMKEEFEKSQIMNEIELEKSRQENNEKEELPPADIRLPSSSDEDSNSSYTDSSSDDDLSSSKNPENELPNDNDESKADILNKDFDNNYQFNGQIKPVFENYQNKIQYPLKPNDLNNHVVLNNYTGGYNSNNQITADVDNRLKNVNYSDYKDQDKRNNLSQYDDCDKRIQNRNISNTNSSQEYSDSRRRDQKIEEYISRTKKRYRYSSSSDEYDNMSSKRDRAYDKSKKYSRSDKYKDKCRRSYSSSSESDSYKKKSNKHRSSGRRR